MSRAVRDERSRRRSAVPVWAAGAAASAAVVGTLTVVTLRSDQRSGEPGRDPAGATEALTGPAGPAAPTAPTAPTTAAEPCRPAVRHDPLPTWARAGFTGRGPAVAHVVGDEGRIVAVLFSDDLHSPPDDEVNKVLWVTRGPQPEPVPGPLRITAVLEGGGRSVHREVAGGPGPSVVDLPRAGCWHLTLRWGPPEERDAMDLEYVAPR